MTFVIRNMRERQQLVFGSQNFNFLDSISSEETSCQSLYIPFPKPTSINLERVETKQSSNHSHKSRKHLIPIVNNIRDLILREGASSTISLLRNITSKVPLDEVNFICTKAIVLLGKNGNTDAVTEVLSLLEQIDPVGADVYSYTAAMSVLIRRDLFKQTIDIFDKVCSKGLELDEISYSCVARAYGHLLHWNETLRLLDDAYVVLSDRVLHVVHASMTNLKYGKFKYMPAQDVLQLLDTLFNWMFENDVPRSSKTMDIALAVICKHGKQYQVQNFLLLMNKNSVFPTRFTFNTLLHRCANDQDVRGALHILNKMSDFGISYDETSFNTILKMHLNMGNIEAASRILDQINDYGFKASDCTKVLNIDFHKQRRDKIAAMKIIDDEMNDLNVSPFMFSHAISSCDDWRHAIILLQRARKAKRVDAVVLYSAAKVCVGAGMHDKAFEILDSMIADQFVINTPTLSLMINVCFRNHQRIDMLSKYLQKVEADYPHLLTDTMCHSVMQKLMNNNEPETACSFHLRFFNTSSCKSQALLSIFTGMQTLSERIHHEHAAQINQDSKVLKRRKILGYNALALIRQYCFSNEYRASQSIDKRSLIKAPHFNSILRMLFLAEMFDEIEKLYELMSGNDSKNNKNIWKPGIFTIAEFVRAAKACKNADMVLDVMLWAKREHILLPIGVISDAISFVYALGRTDSAYDIYKAAYETGNIQHWSQSNFSDVLQVDLHRYSRGMAYAAIRCVLNEIEDMNLRGEGLNSSTTLIIITGKNLKYSFSEQNGKVNDEHIVSDESYRISREVQNILVEDFFPPISSCTCPGNTGRIVVNLEEIHMQNRHCEF